MLEESVLVLVDVQPAFFRVVFEAERVVSRAGFLLRAANLLGVPVLVTTQNAARMGGLDEGLAAELSGPVFDKMTFSCCGAAGFNEALEALDRSQVVLVGAETHICITQTALDLLDAEYQVLLPADAISARTATLDRVGMERLRDVGGEITHTESVVYEWMDTAEHERFKDVLELVKANPPE